MLLELPLELAEFADSFLHFVKADQEFFEKEELEWILGCVKTIIMRAAPVYNDPDKVLADPKIMYGTLLGILICFKELPIPEYVKTANITSIRLFCRDAIQAHKLDLLK